MYFLMFNAHPDRVSEGFLANIVLLECQCLWYFYFWIICMCEFHLLFLSNVELVVILCYHYKPRNADKGQWLQI